MSNNKFTQSRRYFLKSATYTSILSLTGLPSLALAKASTVGAPLENTATQVENGISIMQQKMLDKELVSLMNNTDDAFMLDALHPVKTERVNGSLLVKPNLVEFKEAFCGMIMVLPRERISFEIKTIKDDFGTSEPIALQNPAENHLEISSNHSAFNSIIPVSNFDAVIA